MSGDQTEKKKVETETKDKCHGLVMKVQICLMISGSLVRKAGKAKWNGRGGQTRDENRPRVWTTEREREGGGEWQDKTLRSQENKWNQPDRESITTECGSVGVKVNPRLAKVTGQCHFSFTVTHRNTHVYANIFERTVDEKTFIRKKNLSPLHSTTPHSSITFEWNKRNRQRRHPSALSHWTDRRAEKGYLQHFWSKSSATSSWSCWWSWAWSWGRASMKRLTITRTHTRVFWRGKAGAPCTRTELNAARVLCVNFTRCLPHEKVCPRALSVCLFVCFVCFSGWHCALVDGHDCEMGRRGRERNGSQWKKNA